MLINCVAYQNGPELADISVEAISELRGPALAPRPHPDSISFDILSIELVQNIGLVTEPTLTRSGKAAPAYILIVCGDEAE
jgi:hypothetical protein